VYTDRVTPRHLYLHVPFCVRRCCYCDFAVTVDARPPVSDWIEVVARELELLAAHHGWAAPWTLDTVYCGGGTPSLLGGNAMARLRDRLATTVTWDEGAEWTCEANPESFTTEVARGWREAGVNRISLGAQSFDESVLRWMGRLHGEDGPARALEAARDAGIENASVDLIFGLPARLERNWTGDLRKAIALAPRHISLYGLTAERATPLGRWVAEGREALADEDRYAAEYLEAFDTLEAAGYEGYEVSNFATAGAESRHNQAYWDGRAYLGLGPGAHSFVPPRRWWNARDWHEYAARLSAGAAPLADEERVAGEAASLERTWLALRQRSGLPLDGLDTAQGTLAADWEGRGWAVCAGGRLRLTAEGWLRLDRLAVELDARRVAGVA
jgi:oxygen-independent coproporphyrinogen-3 oxidase